jgi:ribonuclease P protein component
MGVSCFSADAARAARNWWSRLERSNPTSFPKSARLLKSSEFQLSAPQRFQTPLFRVLYSQNGKGRLGVSVSKRVLKGSVQRNRVKRLLRESFRSSRCRLGQRDIIVIGLAPLAKAWQQLKLEDVRGIFSRIEHAS